MAPAIKRTITALLAGLVVMVSGTSAASDSAEDWLARLGPALNMTTYRGIMVYTRGDQVSSMRVAHRYQDGHVDERLVQQDGASGEFVRKGLRVVCVLPDQGRVLLDPVIPSGPFAEAFANRLVPDNPWYQPVLLGDDRVAGFPAKVLLLSARDAHRYSYRLWLERDSGLLLKSHVSAGNGDVLESFQFTDLEITDTLPDSEFEVQSNGHEVTAQLASESDGVEASAVTNGWSLGWRPDGFVPAAAPRPGRGQVAAFSDGLSAFSVFVDPLGELNMPTGASRIGATTAYMRRVAGDQGEYLVTVVGEIPPGTAMKVAESVVVENADAFGAK
ncbi:MucB/RseB C-terminal domain-containing protein [Marinobacter zhejiangensis]|uniref:Sigma E regulatory protein, MucB/RseB n=1 Tax=Marinobacter zhejiangensis TaxID=488535 RepID=A0A1I4N9Y1_9GAMM|nr:MucB/RseB C-terminal domain-containing protein [Marinobacter zhejiangensis]SFM12043.1 sigma E regulatory protein, MucB/RseB [Marinobacter zhejiangensis]